MIRNEDMERQERREGGVVKDGGYKTGGRGSLSDNQMRNVEVVGKNRL